MRLFFAFPLSRAEKARFGDYVDLGREKYPRLKWVKSENIHLTLHFLGDLEGPGAEACRELLHHPRLEGGPFTLSYEGYGRFPSKGIPRVFFVHITDGVERCRHIHDILGNLIRPVAPVETRPFAPHITVARVKGKMDVYPDLRKLPSPRGTLEIRSIVLYESVLQPSGAVYREFARRDLQAEKNKQK